MSLGFEIRPPTLYRLLPINRRLFCKTLFAIICIFGLVGDSLVGLSKKPGPGTDSPETPRGGGCMACHTVIDKPGHENGLQPLRTHPNLKLYVDAGSKHPTNRLGCIACHRGREQAKTFATAGHTPDYDKQVREWEGKYGWKARKPVEDQMFTRRFFYAGCYECHSGQTTIAESGPIDPKSSAGNLDRGLRTIEISGCYGCHAIKGFEGFRKLGPDLTRIASKTDPGWAFRWLRDPRGFRNGPRPRGFRTDARMPNFFLQSNQEDEAEADRPKGADISNAEIEAIVTYLWEKSEVIKYASVTGGEIARGKKLVRTIGCLACHTDNTGDSFSHRSNPRAFGPNFEGTGSKTSQAWIFNWLKDPKRYWKDAHMPDLRLSDEEALDISAYLMTLRNLDFERVDIPKVDGKTRDWLINEYLRGRTNNTEADVKVRTMDDRGKKLFLGQQAIRKYGCFGCHVIKGFENAQPVGSDLTEEGSKSVALLDFGPEADTLDRSLPVWLNAKLRNPRRFDTGKTRNWNDRLKMPNYYFNDQEITDLVTAILGFAKPRMDAGMKWKPTAQTAPIEEGRRIIRDWNCMSCHIIGKEGGAIRSTIEDPLYFPPSLNGEGEKVISVWLFNFLKKPTVIRPWLNVRMPTFDLKDREVNAISRMFCALDNVEYPFETETSKPDVVPRDMAEAGARLFTEFQCMQCHVADQGKSRRDVTDLAPDLSMARSRLRPLWIDKLLRNPETLEAGIRMPGYFPDMRSPAKTILGGDAALQIRALRYHVLSLAGKGNVP